MSTMLRSSTRFLGALVAGGILLLAGLLVATQSALAADPPTITSVAPATGPASGGTAVAITGTGFLAGATVTFDGVEATGVVVNSATQITVNTPVGDQGPATIIVTNTDGQGASLGGAFTYLGPVPTITGITPATGPSSGGTVVTITGTGFATGAAVRFGGTLATNLTVTATQITATTPPHAAGAVTVQVTNPDTQSGSISNGYTFTPAAPPVVTAVSPASGTTGGGTPVTITGTGFVAGATVRFGTVQSASVTFVSATQITATAPAGTGTVAVRVTNPDGQSGTLNTAFTYVTTVAPVVTSVTPGSGPLAGGNSVTIGGTGFLPGATVTFGSINSTGVSVVSATQILATVPAATSASTVGVRVTNTDGKTHTLASAYTYVTNPTVTAVTPNAGSVNGGTLVTITGTNFTATPTVSFGGTAATNVTLVNATTITARTPANSAGMVAVIVQVGAQQAILNNAFTYRALPTVSTLSPTSGPATGGTTVTITGTGFVAPMSVTVGGVAAANVTVLNATTLTATAPVHSAGVVVVEVRSSDGALATGTTLVYTYLAVQSPGTITSGSIPTSGVGLFVFGGGESAQLTSLAVAAGCPASRISFFATSQGRFIAFLPAAPDFVNAAWDDRFEDGIPASTPLVAVCR